MANKDDQNPKDEKSLIEKAQDSISQVDDKIEESVEEMGKKVKSSLKTGVSKTRSFVKKLLLWSLLLGIVALVGYMLYANYTYSEGTRAGNLIKISKKGYVFKTYEGQLKLGGIDLQNQDEGLSDTWSFSVKEDHIFRKLEALQGEKVILRYREINKAMPWQGETNYFVFDIEKRE